ncbi:MAG TPA: flagellar basal body L-ring protein FlgH [Alphaproteobacteria bacterium]|nr:flagellar basal body L-ring protein FlgH [Alphaproteobacteria bacterium]
MSAKFGYLRFLAVAGLVPAMLLAGGCEVGDRLASEGKQPKFSPIVNPQDDPNYQPVSMPMPAPPPEIHAANSIWRSGARSFIKDQRAANVGDLLTVLVSINDQASISNETNRTRTDSENAGASHFLGLEQNLPHILPKAVDPTTLISTNSASAADGKGVITRSEAITLKVAAVVTQVLPNRNLVVSGKQEVRVNYDLRELDINGIVRPEDIASDNTISYEKIAEARISYAGRGQINDVQQPRWGQQLIDILFPF